ncbi:hypothetical protein [Vagococcus fluvialis]|uniref:hypothetical protein n=1 Tax=Vagococcus fluvialis TaxID=2738 RepID=UPI001A90C97B|nr:hypothetical protein [Vagococcus fluvialis]MBO0437187.1 hypothetical protein [Vagococcus fluvialis]
MKEKVLEKQTKKIVFLILLFILGMLIGGLLSNIKHFNMLPFSRNKAVRIPDNTLSKVDPETKTHDLLFVTEESLEFNVEANKIIIYMEHYEKDKLIETKELATLSADTVSKDNLYGVVQWGMVDWDLKEDNLKVGLMVNENIVTSNYTIISKETSAAANSGMIYEKEKITLDKPILIGFWGFGEDSAGSLEFEKNGFNKEELRTNKESFALFFKAID